MLALRMTPARRACAAAAPSRRRRSRRCASCCSCIRARPTRARRSSSSQAMNRYNEELAKAGALLALDGLHPPSAATRLTFSRRRAADGHRRPVHRGQGARRRLLDHPGALEGGGRRVGVARADRRRHDRGAPDRRGGGLPARDRGGAPGCRRSRRSRPSPSSRGGAGARRAAIDAIWRIESARVIATVARMVRDVGLAEDLAQDAVVVALERWPATGIPPNPGGVADRDREAPGDRPHATQHDTPGQVRAARARARRGGEAPDLDAELDDDIGDDLLSLMFTCCHPVLSTEARVALTLRMLGGLTTPEIARAFLVPEPTVGQRISRAKRTLADGGRAVRGAGRRRAAAAPGVGARGRLPDLQRGLRRDGRRRLDAAGADRGGAAARAHPRRPRARGAGGARARRADGDPGLAPGGADRPGRRADPARRPGPPPLGPAADPPRAGGARASRVAAAARSARTTCRPRSPPATRGRGRRRRPTGCGSPRSTRRSRGVAGSPVVELNRAVASGWRSARRSACRPSTRSPPTARSTATTCCRASAATCWRSSGAGRRRGRSSSARRR